jgi:orotidine-5'-phosphate decarboxylase
MSRAPFTDRLATAVMNRESQVCLGLDPNLSSLPDNGVAGTPRERAAAAVSAWGEQLIEAAGPACVAVKLQLARYEVLGAPGWAALEATVGRAKEAGLIVIADGKRGDVPGTAEVYARALLGETETPWGPAPGLGVDAITVNPLLGADALEPFIAEAERCGSGLFVLVRASNPGAADLFDLQTPDVPLHERIAALVAERSARLAGNAGLSGMGAVVGATQPQFLSRLRELMPAATFLLPGVGAQGGSVSELSPAAGVHPAATLIAASRSLAGAADPRAAAERLREESWAALGR